MKIDLLKYTNSADSVNRYLETKAQLSFQDKMNNISIFTGMPLIVSAYYIARKEGETEEFKAAVESLSRFYKYDEILNITEFMKL